MGRRSACPGPCRCVPRGWESCCAALWVTMLAPFVLFAVHPPPPFFFVSPCLSSVQRLSRTFAPVFGCVWMRAYGFRQSFALLPSLLFLLLCFLHCHSRAGRSIAGNAYGSIRVGFFLSFYLNLNIWIYPQPRRQLLEREGACEEM